MKIFDGLKAAQQLDINIAEFVLTHPQDVNELLVIQIGENSISDTYVQMKKKYCDRLGIPLKHCRFVDSYSTEKLSSEINNLVASQNVVSCIVQLPIPKTYQMSTILDLLPLDKDIDMLSSQSMSNLLRGVGSRVSPVIRSLQNYINASQILLSSATTCVIGDGYLVGKPIASYLQRFAKSVDIITDYEIGMPINYDLAILAAGVPNLVSPEDLHTGTNVVDFGTTLVDGKVTGDLDTRKIENLQHLDNVSLSPRGMGPLVVRYLLLNHLRK